MWGHYTNNYKGYCLKFKNESFLKNRDVQIKSHVAYLKDYKPTNENINKAHSEIGELPELDKEDINLFQIILEALYSYCWKYYDWQYEQEFRAISWTTNNFNRALKFEEHDVEGIYIGHKLKTEDSEFYAKLINILNRKYPNIKRFEVNPNPLVVKLEFTEL